MQNLRDFSHHRNLDINWTALDFTSKKLSSVAKPKPGFPAFFSTRAQLEMGNEFQVKYLDIYP